LTQYLLSIGSNIGDRQKNLEKAIQLLNESSIIKKSSIYLTSPVDYINQDDFYNISVIILTDMPPHTLLKFTQNIEKKMGRQKIIDKGPRNIDIDIILWEKGIFKSENLKIPHIAAFDRIFVIKPSLEILDDTKLSKYKVRFHQALERKGLFENQNIEIVL